MDCLLSFFESLTLFIYDQMCVHGLIYIHFPYPISVKVSRGVLTVIEEFFGFTDITIIVSEIVIIIIEDIMKLKM